jgi:hypothetical protein
MKNTKKPLLQKAQENLLESLLKYQELEKKVRGSIFLIQVNKNLTYDEKQRIILNLIK